MIALCPARIDLAGAPRALADIRSALGRTRAGQRCELNLAGLTGFDSAALAVLLAVRRDHGSRLTFRNVPANLRTLARLYGVEALLFDPPSPASHGGSDQPLSTVRPIV